MNKQYWDKLDKTFDPDDLSNDPNQWKWKDKMDDMEYSENEKYEYQSALYRELAVREAEITHRYEEEINKLYNECSDLSIKLNIAYHRIQTAELRIDTVNAVMRKLMFYAQHKDSCVYLDKISCGRMVELNETKDCTCGLIALNEQKVG